MTAIKSNPENTFQAENTIAFVTGANRPNGIGRAVVDALLAAGARKVYATARDPQQLAELVEQSAGRVVAVPLDVTDAGSIRAAVANAPDVNLLVNNSGFFGGVDSLADLDIIKREIDVNYYGPIALTAAFAPVLSNNGGGHVVNVNSIASFVNFPLGSTYSASKAASHSVTIGQRRELAPQGTHVIGVYPGPIATDLAKDIEMDKFPPSLVADAILAGLRDGSDEVFPDAFSQGLFAQWQQDGKAVEREMAAAAAEAATATAP